MPETCTLCKKRPLDLYLRTQDPNWLFTLEIVVLLPNSLIFSINRFIPPLSRGDNYRNYWAQP